MNDETMRVLEDAHRTVQMVIRNEILCGVGLVCGIALLVLVFLYINERWTWMPRKRHNRVFIEKF